MKKAYIRPVSSLVIPKLESTILNEENPSGFAGQSRVTVGGTGSSGGSSSGSSIVFGAKGQDITGDEDDESWGNLWK